MDEVGTAAPGRVQVIDRARMHLINDGNLAQEGPESDYGERAS